ncbi:hypothetical protein NEDG_01725 [Nematocida displodere]|uniref:Uncharacterized protein n=1 Tax=Nematocida displodere TaxID=1805483 RepID=A0A177EG92_9MICR|nr:hypothetical protein NEDG_01725 [Nematocida displodere]
MKKLGIYMNESAAVYKNKRAVPETWKDSMSLCSPDQSIREKEDEVFLEVKRRLYEEHRGAGVVRFKIGESSSTSTIDFHRVADTCAVSRVVYIVNVKQSVVPIEKYTRGESSLFMKNFEMAEKRVKYSCKSGTLTASFKEVLDESVLSVVFVLDSPMKRLKSLIDKRKQTDGKDITRKALVLLSQLLEASQALNAPVLDILNVYVRETSDGVDVLHLPITKNRESAVEYLYALVSLLIPTYTAMEKAVIMNRMVKEKKTEGALQEILLQIYESWGVSDWKERYAAISKRILAHATGYAARQEVKNKA